MITDHDLRTVRQALAHSEQRCRFHGQDWDKLGWEPYGLPRCDSCKQPYRVMRALDLIDRARAHVEA